MEWFTPTVRLLQLVVFLVNFKGESLSSLRSSRITDYFDIFLSINESNGFNLFTSVDPRAQSANSGIVNRHRRTIGFSLPLCFQSERCKMPRRGCERVCYFLRRFATQPRSPLPALEFCR